ncbi:MAG TPA: FHA domain-containing protein [Thermoleophilaceae bacterium]
MADLILEIVEGEDAGRQTPVVGSVEIGREAAFALDDEQASRHHARVSAQGDVGIVQDLGSTNGTYVNDQPIEGPRAVRPGDKIRVGLTVLELRTAQDVQRQPSAVMPMPQVTRLSNEVLEPVPEAELEPEPGAAAPAFAIEETTPGFVPQDVADDPEARSDYAAVARLVDSRVKRQTHLATFALLAASGLAVLLVFGLK